MAQPRTPTIQQPIIDGSVAARSMLLKFSPETSCVRSRRIKISVDVGLVADREQAVEFYTILLLNGSPERPFVLSTTPGDLDAVQRAIWYVKLNNKKSNEVRLKVIAVKTESGLGERVIEATRHYRISRRSC